MVKWQMKKDFSKNKIPAPKNHKPMLSILFLL